MLKIKDNVDLKELEKFGFKECFSHSHSEYTMDYEVDESCLVVDCTTRELYYMNTSCADMVGYGYKLLEKLYELIKADLVEKVEELK